MRMSPPLRPDVRTPTEYGPVTLDGVGGRLPEDEDQRCEQVGGVAVEPVRVADALADVPGVHGVVDELELGVEHRRHRAP